MAQTNIIAKRHAAANLMPEDLTYEGAPAHEQSMEPSAQLRRSVCSCLLFEGEFYESGETISDRIIALVGQVSASEVAALALKARGTLNLRHVPLLLTAALADHHKGTSLVADLAQDVVQRADELGELLAIRAKIKGLKRDERGHLNVNRSLTHGLRRGLARAFLKFGVYALAKYDRDSASIKLRDVMRLVHPKPGSPERKAIHGQVLARELPTPDTWEVLLSAGADKKETFTRLLQEEKLGYLALLRNLRNMEQAGVDHALVERALLARRGGAEKVLPFRYVAAARAAPSFQNALRTALAAALQGAPVFGGATAVLVDVSGSMEDKLSARSDLTRMDAAAALAVMIRCERKRIFSFSEMLVEVNQDHASVFELIERIEISQSHSSTFLGRAVEGVVRECGVLDRLIVISDEQSHDRVPDVLSNVRQPYMINVASARNGVGYGEWIHVDGFSESVLTWMTEIDSRVSMPS